MTSLLSMMMIRIVLVVGMEAAEDNGSRRKSKSGCRLASEEAKYSIIDERQKLSLSHFAFAIALLSG